MTERKTKKKNRKRPGTEWGISAKTAFVVALFCLVVLLAVFVFQILLLDVFYEGSRIREAKSMDSHIQEGWNEVNFTELFHDYANKHDLNAILCEVENGVTFVQMISWVNTGVRIYGIKGDDFNYYYQCAVQSKNGLYIEKRTENVEEEIDIRLPPKEEPYQSEGETAPRWEEQVMPFFSRKTERSAVYVHVFDKGGKTYMLILNIRLNPVDATRRTLLQQLGFVFAFILAVGTLVAVFLSRYISEPIVKMNQAAKELARGRYDADFTGKGYREVRELGNSLTYASQELSKIDGLQKELIANISHDLRTPITMIKGYAEVIRDLPGENTPENMQVIIDEATHMSELVNDLLDLSRLQNGTREPVVERFNLTGEIRSMTQRYIKFLEQQKYVLSFEYDRDAYVVADRVMIMQVVYNLLNNAFNYTGEDKTITIRQTIRGDLVRIMVTDTGDGIGPEQIPLIWDRYYKVDRVHRRAMVGTGLGLSIVKEILQAHSAGFGVESKVGQGSTFWFELKQDGEGQKDE
ncbi:MAG: HAMP domain-containing histidine kinase [Clostridia bacterium]|nr:HAMP domain-containing histidine kinase [Clostridia bacterium]